jgi:hypothetical protein
MVQAYLVTVEGLRGPEAQIWYGEPGKFVGPSDNSVLKMRLPDQDEPWSIAAALSWAERNPDGARN